MAKVIPLGEPVELRDDGRNVPGASTRHGSARVYDLAERRAASRIEELAARELALRAQPRARSRRGSCRPARCATGSTAWR